MSSQIDHANINDVTRMAIAESKLPPMPHIQSLDWRPPQQTVPVATPGGDLSLRLKIFADSDIHEWQEWMIDTEHPDASQTSVMSYWDGKGCAKYTATPRSYWVAVPNSYTNITPGGTYTKEYATSVGIETTDSTTLAAELGIDIKGLSAKLTATFQHSVTTSETRSETTSYSVGGPLEGFTRVWMLWQLFDELAALDENGQVISNPQRHADVNWSQHAAGGGAFVQYRTVRQIFPTDILAPIQADFPTPP